MISQNIKDRIAKIYELVKRGATEGEKAAAKTALDNLLKKYNLEGIDLENINKELRKFKYSTSMELTLLAAILLVLVEDKEAIKSASRNTYKCRHVEVSLTYMDYVTADCAYEYFRRHMKEQWNKLCIEYVNKCRKAKTKNRRRAELQEAFIQRYIINSKLYREGDIYEREIDLKALSAKELNDYMIMQQIEGGQYNRQMTNGLLIESK